MTTDDSNRPADHLDRDQVDRELDERLHRLLTERAEGVRATADIGQVLAAADRPLPSAHRSRLFYVGSVAAAVLVILAGIGVVGLIGEEPTVLEQPADQPVEPSTTTVLTTVSSTTEPSTTVSSTTTEQQPADCPPGQLPVEDGCRPPSTTTTTAGVSTSVVTSVVTSSTTTTTTTGG